MKQPFHSTFLRLLTFAVITSFAHAQKNIASIPDTAIEAQLKAFSLIKGAKINLFASEPLVPNPTHMNWDQRGRLWVVSTPLYPHIKPSESESDKIVILEDTDGDGVADKSTDFATNLHLPMGVLPGDSGVYVSNATDLLFLKDTDGDDVADERKVVLSGFGTEDSHHILHTLRWGPEGMLWMNQSIYIHTHLETPQGIRRLSGAGMWHYNTHTRQPEVFMRGTCNPWGHAFDEWGQSFLSDGAGSEGLNSVFPRSVFFTAPGASRILQGLSKGQPKHCSAETLSGRHLPQNLQNVIAAPDFRGNRINLFQLTDKGSSYNAAQLPDLVSSTHGAFRPIDIKMGPDGAIYIADWYNPIIQHGEVDFRDPRRDKSHGRIWRITFENSDLIQAPNLIQASEAELITHSNAPEGWTREAAMLELRKRKPEDIQAALKSAKAPSGVDHDLFVLRKLWLSQAIDRFDSKDANPLLASPNHKARVAALRALYFDAKQHPQALAIAEKAISDPHPQVRLWAVSVLAQLDSPETVAIALRALDGIVADEFLDFAVWSICREHAARWTPETTKKNPFPNSQQLLYAVRAINEAVALPLLLTALQNGDFTADTEVAGLADLIANVGSADELKGLFDYALSAPANPAQQKNILQALSSSASLRKVQASGDTSRLTQFLSHSDPAIVAIASTLAGQWKLESARDVLASALSTEPADETRARTALDGLIALGGDATNQLFSQLATDEKKSYLIRSLAVIGQMRISPELGAKLAIAVLNSSPDGTDPHGIYEAFLSDTKGADALTAALAQAKLSQAIASLGAQKASSSASKPDALLAAIQKAGDLAPMKAALTPEEMETMMQKVASIGDAKAGELIYRRPALQCAVCHAIGEVGGAIGPNMVSIGASAPVDYLIDSLLLPSKKIKEGYHTTLVTMKDGKIFSGAISGENANELVVRDAAGKENTIAKSEIASNQISPVSLMPQGLTSQLREDEFIHLVRFLSELGKEGAYKSQPNRYLRNWRALLPHLSNRDRVGHYGTKNFAQEFPEYTWLPIYSKVDGTLPTDELLDLTGLAQKFYKAAHSFIRTKTPGSVKLKISGELANLELFHGETKISLPESGESAEAEIQISSPGLQKITVVGLKGEKLKHILVEILEPADKVELLSVASFPR
jgi:putative heme-binding domain-containing protein